MFNKTQVTSLSQSLPPLLPLAAAMLLALAGCGGPDESAPGSTEWAPPADAPLLAERYPLLAGGVLGNGHLAELPDGVLLRADGFSISQQELEADIENAPPHLRETLGSNLLLVLEQRATQSLVTALARQRIPPDPDMDGDRLLQRYFEELTGDVLVSEAEARTFFDENRAMIGNAEFDQIRPRIEEFLRQQKQQEMVETHLRDLGRHLPFALSEQWVDAQVPRMLDNPLDRARASGTPTMASFGADSCMPCQMMKPIREAVQKKYEGKLNVVYVHADRDQILASRYGVRGIPHTLFFDTDGKEVHAETGMMSEEQIEDQLRKMGVQL